LLPVSLPVILVDVNIAFEEDSAVADSQEVVALRGSLSALLGLPAASSHDPDTDWTRDWPELAALGVCDVLDPEAGAGEEAALMAVAVAEEVGRALHPFPAHAVVPPALLRPQLEPLLPAGFENGIVALVRGSHLEHAEGRLTGSLEPACGLAGVSHLLVLGPDGGLHLVDATDSAVVSSALPSLDVTRTFSTVRLTGAASRPVAHDDGRVALFSRLLVVADTASVLADGVRRTVEHARTRIAFGGPIGRFQAVQHRLVDHRIVADQLDDLVRVAVRAIEDTAGETSDAVRAVVVAEVFSAEAAVQVLSDCIQLAGGTGFTWEHGLHLSLRRCHGNAQLAGGARRARAALADVSGW
jgi:alkylation response protein AidB-like acyl-CoA dehydrogenase